MRSRSFSVVASPDPRVNHVNAGATAKCPSVRFTPAAMARRVFTRCSMSQFGPLCVHNRKRSSRSAAFKVGFAALSATSHLVAAPKSGASRLWCVSLANRHDWSSMRRFSTWPTPPHLSGARPSPTPSCSTLTPDGAKSRAGRAWLAWGLLLTLMMHLAVRRQVTIHGQARSSCHPSDDQLNRSPGMSRME